MIPLAKSAIPGVLAANHEAWTAELLGYLQRGEAVPEGLARRYKDPSIRSAVEAETTKKCAYCEGRMLHVAWGGVEHIKPKSRFPELTFSWPNLTLCCERCNTAKGPTYDEAHPPINPYAEQPAEFLSAVGALMAGRPGRARGGHTIRVLELNRPDLVEQRSTAIQGVLDYAELIFNTGDPAVRRELVEELKKRISADREYSFALASALQSAGYELD